jgi:hypothetical protein
MQIQRSKLLCVLAKNPKQVNDGTKLCCETVKSNFQAVCLRPENLCQPKIPGTSYRQDSKDFDP